MQTIHITLPQISAVVSILFILQTGRILTSEFDQIVNLYNPAVYSVSDVFDTYIYRVGVGKMQYDFTTAVGLFKNLVGFTLVMTTNSIVKKFGQEGII